MKLFLAKLAFVHRRLWQRDGTYRAAVVLGPPPLLAAILAALLWLGVHASSPPRPATAPLPPWAAPSGPRTAVSTDAPRAIAPGMELPASGLPAGLVAGWRGGIQPVEIGAAMDANVLPKRLAPLVLDEPSLDLQPIMKAGPAIGRFVGVGMATLVIHTAGIYALTLRLQRADTERLTCLQRLVFDNQRVVSNLELDLLGPATRNFEPVSFALQPGLYPIAAAFGCWADQQEKGAARLSVLIRHPGEQDFRPARADEILRSAVTP